MDDKKLDKANSLRRDINDLQVVVDAMQGCIKDSQPIMCRQFFQSGRSILMNFNMDDWKAVFNALIPSVQGRLDKIKKQYEKL